MITPFQLNVALAVIGVGFELVNAPRYLALGEAILGLVYTVAAEAWVRDVLHSGVDGLRGFASGVLGSLSPLIAATLALLGGEALAAELDDRGLAELRLALLTIALLFYWFCLAATQYFDGPTFDRHGPPQQYGGVGFALVVAASIALPYLLAVGLAGLISGSSATYVISFVLSYLVFNVPTATVAIGTMAVASQDG